MSVVDSLKSTLHHPATAVMGAVGALAGLGFDPASTIVLFLWANAGTLFTVSGVVVSDFAPRMPAIPKGTAETVSLVLGSLYVAKLLRKVYERYDKS